MGEVMPLTPEDVSNKRFTPVRLREGYDMGEVDQFLDEVEAELARLTKENDDLRTKLSSAQGASSASPAAEAPAAAAARPPRRSGGRRCRRRPTPRHACSRSPPATPTSWSTRPRATRTGSWAR